MQRALKRGRTPPPPPAAAQAVPKVVGGSTIQLISPTSEDSEFAEFLSEGGPGLHHIGYRVDSASDALAALSGSGREVLDEEPVLGPRQSKTAYLHPDTSFGVLVQLVER